MQPSPDRWDEDALEYYRQIIRGMLDRKLEPMVTLHHFTDPLWLTEQGGWEQEGAVTFFAAYVKESSGSPEGLRPPVGDDQRTECLYLGRLCRGRFSARKK